MNKILLFCVSSALLCSCNGAPKEVTDQSTTDTAVMTVNPVEKAVSKEETKKPLFDKETLKSEWLKAFDCNSDCSPKEYAILDLNGDGMKELLCRDKESNRLAIFRIGDKLDLYACNFFKETGSEISFYLYNDAVVTSGGVSALAVESIVPFSNGDVTVYKEILGGLNAKHEMVVAGVKKDLSEVDFEKERAKYKDEISNMDSFEWVKF